MNRLIWPSLVLLTVAGCSDCGGESNNFPSDAAQTPDMTTSDLGVDAPQQPPDASRDLGTDAPDLGTVEVIGSRVPSPVQPGVAGDGRENVDVPLSEEAAAGRIQGDHGFTGIWSHCKTGDFKLYNGRVEACISNEQSNRYEMFRGGGLVDVRVIGTEAEEIFDVYTPRIGWNTIHADTVRVIRDGSDGGAAVIRVEGTDMPAAYFVGVVGENLFDPQHLDVILEYRLGPDHDFIEILTYVTNHSGRRVQVQKGDLLAFGSRAEVFRQHYGFGSVGGDPFDWITAHGLGHSYAWVTPDDKLTSLSGAFGSPPWEMTQAEQFVLEEDESFAHFGRLVVGDGNLDHVLVRARELSTQPAGIERTITVNDEAGLPVADRRVTAFVDETPWTSGITDAQGQVRLTHPNGAVRYDVSGADRGGEHSEEIEISEQQTEVGITVPAVGTITFGVTVDGAAVPASVRVRWSLGSIDTVAWDGSSVGVLPGEYDVEIGRGPEYDFVRETVNVVAGENVTVQAALSRVMDTSDWIAADFHQHMEPSPDSRVPVRDRLLDNLAEGVEMIVPTDHDIVTDLSPYIAELGLQDWVNTMPGAEASPVLAHMNVYPLAHRADQPGRGTIPLSVLEDGEPRRRSVPELIAAARATATDPVVQINHGRDSSGLFDLVEYDPELGPDAVTHNWWTTDFDAMEILNGGQCQQFYDWASLWNFGLTPTGIGSSDSHGLWGQVGEDRSYLYMPGVEVSDITREAVRDVVRAGQVVLASSAMLEFTDGKVPGDTITGGGPHEFPLRVQSAPWSTVNEINVIVNGVIVQTTPVTSISETLDYEDTVNLTVSEDAWVVIMASGPSPSGPYRPSGKRTYAFNNPIRIDVDDDGFDAPGIQPLQLAALPICD